MGLGTNQTGVVVADKWIGEIWQDEAVATYEAKAVMRNLVEVFQHQKNKGDVIHRPNPARGDSSAKTVNTQVTLIADTAGEITISINKHYEYSKMYEDIADMLALNGMKRFYTKDAGYALARRVDAELHKLGAIAQGGSIAGATNLYEKGVIGGDGSTNFSGASSGNGTALTDVGLRTAMQTLEDADVNTSECGLVVPPTVIKTLRGIARFTEQAFVGDGNAIKTGRIGNLYGVEVYASSLCPWIHCNSTTGTQSVNFSGTTLSGAAVVDEFGFTVDHSAGTESKYRACLLVHPDAMVLAEAQSVRVQQQYKQEYLGYLVTADNVFGTAELRDYGSIAIVVPA
jgi:hypothetical protein